MNHKSDYILAGPMEKERLQLHLVHTHPSEGKA